MPRPPFSTAMLCIALMPLCGLPDVSVARPTSQAGGVVIIGNDSGGFIRRRAEEITRYSAEGVQVQIRGRYCNSACTMYLGVPGVCIQADTLFGFHGVRAYGVFPVAEPKAKAAAAFLAQYYPPPLRHWFMTVARHSTLRLHKIRGAHLIAMGVQKCS